MFLTATEKNRLVNRVPDPELSEEEFVRFRNHVYHSDASVRRKIKTWVTDAEDVLFALKNMPVSKLQKDIPDEAIFDIFMVGLEFLEAFSFVPVDKDKVIGTYPPSISDISDLSHIYTRYATENEIGRNMNLRGIAHRLEGFVTRKNLWNELEKMYAAEERTFLEEKNDRV